MKTSVSAIALSLLLLVPALSYGWSPGPYSFDRCVDSFDVAVRGTVSKVEEVARKKGGWVLSRADVKLVKAYRGVRAKTKTVSFYFWSATDNKLTLAHGVRKGDNILVFLSRDLSSIASMLPGGMGADSPVQRIRGGMGADTAAKRTKGGMGADTAAKRTKGGMGADTAARSTEGGMGADRVGSTEGGMGADNPVFFLQFAKANHKGYLFKIEKAAGGTVVRDAVFTKDKRAVLSFGKAEKLLRKKRTRSAK